MVPERRHKIFVCVSQIVRFHVLVPGHAQKTLEKAILGQTASISSSSWLVCVLSGITFNPVRGQRRPLSHTAINCELRVEKWRENETPHGIMIQFSCFPCCLINKQMFALIRENCPGVTRTHTHVHLVGYRMLHDVICKTWGGSF